jgi:hypothetical protein
VNVVHEIEFSPGILRRRTKKYLNGFSDNAILLGVTENPQKHFGRNQNAALRLFPNGLFEKVSKIKGRTLFGHAETPSTLTIIIWTIFFGPYRRSLTFWDRLGVSWCTHL